MSMFKPATREKTKARVLLAGPSGSGKTRAALEIARGLGDRIAVIDTENRSASLYVGLNGLRFDVCELQPPYTYEKYLQAMRDCFNSRAYDVLVIDSLTHVWSGEGGALETVDRLAGRGGNNFTAWKDVTPEHNRLLTAISASPIHLLCTVRTKTAYVMEERENRQGRMVQTPRKVGMAPIFREGVEYEFSVQLDINLDHEVRVTKTRITELDGSTFAPHELSVIGSTMREFHETGTVPSRVGAMAPANAQQRPQPIPTKTAKNYVVKSVADRPFTEISDADLGHYLSYYTEKLPTLTQPNHVAAVQATIAAAEREMSRRLAEEGDKIPDDDDVLDEPPIDTSYEAEKHSAYHTDDNPPAEGGQMVEYIDPDGVVRQVPANSLEGQLALSLAAKGTDRTDVNEQWGMSDGHPTKAVEPKRTRRSAS